MPVSICTDNQGRIIGINLSDMAGNTGWSVVSEEAMTAHAGTSIAEFMDTLSDAQGVALYAFRDGFAERRTPEEIEADTPDTETTNPTEAERIATLEMESIATMEAIAEVYEMILGGM